MMRGGLRSWLESFAVVLAMFVASTPWAQSNLVHIFVDHVEVDGTSFESVEELREYLLAARDDFIGVFVAECRATPRKDEVMRVVMEVLLERITARGQGVAVNVVEGSVLCP